MVSAFDIFIGSIGSLKDDATLTINFGIQPADLPPGMHQVHHQNDNTTINHYRYGVKIPA